MPVNKEAYRDLSATFSTKNIALVAVSKTKPVSEILALYELGHRDFGENYVQELSEKQEQLPGDIRWHFIGHLQSNKVKIIAPFIHLIHGVDSLKLLKEINRQANKAGRTINVLLQVHIAQEETKFGLDATEAKEIIDEYLSGSMPNIRIKGFMGIASFTENKQQVKAEFHSLKILFDGLAARLKDFDTLSMGMSGDYEIAMEEGSNMVRIGSLLFGLRT